jgi:D-alanyl-D-alanine endopeptidase (penicillin-binding protein 7)
MFISKTKILIVISLAAYLIPQMGLALDMPTSIGQLAEMEGLSARSYVVVDKASGQVLVSKNSGAPWVPASLTKLVTALVVLDTKPNLKKVMTMTQADQNAGGCSAGGACLATKPGIKYTVNNLFYASLLASANNATHALARSTGLTDQQFVEKMNEKAKNLGATSTTFYEVTGMDPANTTTALDYAKISLTAFSQPLVKKIVTTQTYNFYAYNSKKYYHKLKNTDKLLGDNEVTIIGGKTGYLEESLYNFTAELKNKANDNLIVVLFGSKDSASQFSETKRLAQLGNLAKIMFLPQAAVLGAAAGENIFNN